MEKGDKQAVQSGDNNYKRVQYSDKPRVEYVVGQEINVHFYRDKEDNFLGKAESGIICFIDRELKKKVWVDAGSDWVCKITEVFPKKLIVEPVELYKSELENEIEVAKKLSTIGNVKFRSSK